MLWPYEQDTLWQSRRLNESNSRFGHDRLRENEIRHQNYTGLLRAIQHKLFQRYKSKFKETLQGDITLVGLVKVPGWRVKTNNVRHQNWKNWLRAKLYKFFQNVESLANERRHQNRMDLLRAKQYKTMQDGQLRANVSHPNQTDWFRAKQHKTFQDGQ